MRQKIIIIRSIATIFVIIWLFRTLTLVTDPAERRHFFEITRDGENSFKVTVTGSDWY